MDYSAGVSRIFISIQEIILLKKYEMENTALE